MRRRTRLLLAVVAVGVIAAVGATLVAMALGGDSTGIPRPAGAQTVLRVEPARAEISCDSGTVPVFIYLDDLAARPSPNQPGASYGVAAFQVLLQYDPAVVRVAGPVNVELNAALNQEDPDRDGLTRTFFSVSSIDDLAGRALVGAASFSATRGARLEEGPDPVAKGEPLLLMTVRLVPVGHGSTALTLADPERAVSANLGPGVMDPAQVGYEQVTFRNASLNVSGGTCGPTPPATPRPTPKPSPTAYVEPTWTPVPWRTVTPQDAALLGRSDCLSGWLAYGDPQARFSICYPPDFTATASDFAVNIHSPRVAGQAENLISVAVSWSKASGYAVLGEPSPQTCPEYRVMGQTSSTYLEVALGGRAVPACFNQGVLEGEPTRRIGSVKGAIALAADASDREGFILFNVGFVGADVARVPSLADAVIHTLSVNFR